MLHSQRHWAFCGTTKAAFGRDHEAHKVICGLWFDFNLADRSLLRPRVVVLNASDGARIRDRPSAPSDAVAECRRSLWPSADSQAAPDSGPW